MAVMQKCQSCLKEYERKSGRQKYCSECGVIENRKSITNWTKTHSEHLKKYENSRKDKKKINWQNYKEANPLAGRQRAAKRRLRIDKFPKEHIDRTLVYIRDSGICGLCGGQIPINKFVVDHIIPVARGGAELYANVHASHSSCNR